jgi:uncharacterized heparinase superfamily protein
LSWLQYARTLRYLRPVQFYGFARHRLLRCLPAGPATVQGTCISECVQPPLGPFLSAPTSVQGTTLTFLNHTVDYPCGIDWYDPAQTKLWRYNLHYMHYLHQPGMTRKAQRDWMYIWVRGNPDPTGEGWEPFPTSLRLVNWFKLWWTDGVSEEDAPLLASAYAQARHVRRWVEHQHRGNPLFENLKTLFWAGCTFRHPEAAQWQRWAARHLLHQLHEQILADGGHYERSPMYHAQILEGCLDLWNIQSAWMKLYSELAALLASKLPQMLAWLETMSHPDGEIALCNDAAFRIAPAPAQLLDYGRRLGCSWPTPGCCTHLPESGYVVQRDRGHYIVIDIGPLGPDYQLAHAHCDLFSFEWSVASQRIVCDTGVYAYQDQVMRPYVRATAAHNTVRIDGTDQSEMWKEFRVARRAYPERTSVDVVPDETLRVVGQHNGYRHLVGHPVHRREFKLRHGRLVLRDTVTGNGTHVIEAFLHFHPAITVHLTSAQTYRLTLAERIIGHIAYEHWQEASLSQGWYCPEFGKREPNTVLRLAATAQLPFTGCIMINLAEAPSVISPL